MRPGDIIPIRGKFEDPKAFLHHIAADDEIESFVMLTVHKDGTIGSANFKMTRANMAYASVIIAGWSIREDF